MLPPHLGEDEGRQGSGGDQRQGQRPEWNGLPCSQLCFRRLTCPYSFHPKAYTIPSSVVATVWAAPQLTPVTWRFSRAPPTSEGSERLSWTGVATSRGSDWLHFDENIHERPLGAAGAARCTLQGRASWFDYCVCTWFPPHRRVRACHAPPTPSSTAPRSS